MNVMVTGGAGYIGSVAVDCLIDAGHQVVVFDNLFLGHRDAINQQATFCEGDLNNREHIKAAIKRNRPEAIMHFASNSLVGESMAKPSMYLGDNVTNAVNLIDCAAEAGVQRFILSSTAALFGAPEKMPISESELITPGSPYGESKRIIEQILKWYQQTHGLRYAALRYFNAAGGTQRLGEDHSPETHLIPLVLQVALGQRDNIKIFGDDYPTPDGTCIRDYIHVADLAEAHLLALQALEKNETLHYNLGNGSGFSVKEVIETCRQVTQHPIPAETVARRPGDPAKLIADSQKIREELGWNPKFPDLDTIVSSAWNWHQQNPKGYAE